MLIPTSSEPMDWDAISATAAVAALLGGLLASVATQLFPWMRAKLATRSIQHRLGAEDYLPQVLERAVRYYVQPRCTSIDPAGREDYRAVYPTSEKLFKALDRALHDPYAGRYFILLADSGMGKTSALINYYVRHLRGIRRRKTPIVMFYLGKKGVIDALARVPDPHNTVLFLDALDEDLEAVREHRARVAAIMEAARDFRTVVITCRSQFFLSEDEITRDTGIAVLGPRAAGEGGKYRFEKLYLAPFSDREIQSYLRKRYPFWNLRSRSRARQTLDRVGDLTARPMLLAYVDDLLQRGQQLESLSDAYERIVSAWIEREELLVADLSGLRSLSELLAVEIYLHRDQWGGEQITQPQLELLLYDAGVALESWQLTGRSLLNRGAAGNYKFAHRSIMEYLFVQALGRDIRAYTARWTHLMVQFVTERILSSQSLAIIGKNVRLPPDTEDMYQSNAGAVFRQLCRTSSFREIKPFVWSTMLANELLFPHRVHGSSVGFGYVSIAHTMGPLRFLTSGDRLSLLQMSQSEVFIHDGYDLRVESGEFTVDTDLLNQFVLEKPGDAGTGVRSFTSPLMPDADTDYYTFASEIPSADGHAYLLVRVAEFDIDPLWSRISALIPVLRDQAFVPMGMVARPVVSFVARKQIVPRSATR